MRKNSQHVSDDEKNKAEDIAIAKEVVSGRQSGDEIDHDDVRVQSLLQDKE